MLFLVEWCEVVGESERAPIQFHYAVAHVRCVIIPFPVAVKMFPLESAAMPVPDIQIPP